MSKPFSNPFFEADMSKFLDFSKTSSDWRLPTFCPEAWMSSQRRNIEAYTSLNQAVMESFQSLWRRQADVARQMVEETSQMVRAAWACPTAEEKVIRQAEAGKAAIDKCLASLRDATETLSKCNAQAMDTVSTRINEGMNELRGIIKTS